SLGMRSRLQRATAEDKQGWLSAHDAVARALDLERLLGSFNHSERDNFPIRTIDQVADNMLLWIDEEGFQIVPKITNSVVEPLPDTPFDAPNIFDNETRKFVLHAAAD